MESSEESCSFDPPPFSLRTQPQRPGELCELVEFTLEAADARLLCAGAAAVGLPIELAVYIWVEAERSLAEAIELLGIEYLELAAFLDRAAVQGLERAPRHQFVRPLEDYGAALRRAAPHAEVERDTVHARVPHRVAAAWAHAAAASGLTLERWLAATVRRAENGRVLWEAAAAGSGRTLAEWVLVQAARCARSRSTSPHTTACG